jgi:endonuclease/exonuclease/phosphatase family metal-dependent hydrolase
MKIKIVSILFVVLLAEGSAKAQDSLVVMFWNLENFFDHLDGGGGETDAEFTPEGIRHWTKGRFYAKCDAVAKSIMWTADIYGRMPDLIGLAEIENRGVLEKLVRSTLLRKYSYRIIHHDSGDPRGIDVAILYRTSSMKLLESSLRTPRLDGAVLPTRDILHARMSLSDSLVIDFIVNHHPFKFSGARESQGKRLAAMQAMTGLCDSLGTDRIISMGDFNDLPDSPAFSIIGDCLVNKSLGLYKRGKGTIRYEGRWELIDQFLVSPSLSESSTMHICRIPFLMVRDRKHPGEKPLRTFTGPRYTAGVSDHCPIILTLSP